jgi:glycosyltransferase involved in cell wall biosynthesis
MGNTLDRVNLMRASEIFLFPSLWENSPVALLVAMGMGKAIVAAAVGGVPEMIEDRHSGLLAETGNPGISRKRPSRAGFAGFRPTLRGGGLSRRHETF